MSTVTIHVKSKKLKKGDSIPELKDKSQKTIIVFNDDTIKWKYDNNSDITIDSDSPFNGNSSSTQVSGKGEVETTVNGATSASEKILSYNITTSDTDTELDPVIIIREPDPEPLIFKNPIVTFVIGLVAGVILGRLL